MPRKQDRYAEKAANKIRVNGETITAGQLSGYRGSERRADVLRSVARYARIRRLQGDTPMRTGNGSIDAVIRAEGNYPTLHT